jgi:hypothetical protein
MKSRLLTTFTIATALIAAARSQTVSLGELSFDIPDAATGKRLHIKVFVDTISPALALLTEAPKSAAIVTSADAQKTAVEISVAKAAAAAARPLKELQIDMPISTSPALIALGASPTAIPRATTPREFALQLAKGIGRDGKIATGVSGEISIYRLLNRTTLNVGEYQENASKRLLANTTLSFATPAAATNSGNVAIGLQTVWIDQLDPTANKAITNCFSGVFDSDPVTAASNIDFAPEKVAEQVAAADIPLRTAAQTKSVATLYANCFAAKAKHSGYRFATGLGQAWISPENTPKSLSRGSGVYWATGSYTLGGVAIDPATSTRRDYIRSELIAHLRMHKKQPVADPADAAKQTFQDLQIAAAKLRFSNTREDLAGLLEVSRQRSRISGIADEVVNRRVVGIEFKVGPDYWLNLGIGSETGRRDGKNAQFGLANLKFGSSSGAIFKP